MSVAEARLPVASQPSRGDSLRAGRLVPWFVALAIAAVSAIAFARAPFTRVPDALFVSDGFGYYLYLPSALIDHDLDFTNQLGRLPYEGSKAFFKVSEATGRPTNQFPVGTAILLSPFFLLADLAVLGLNVLGVGLPRTGFGYAYEFPVYLGSFAYGLAGLWLCRRVLRREFDEDTADLSLFAIVFATPLVYYLTVEPNMSHAVAFFATALWLERLQAIDRTGDRRLASWMILGLVLGIVGLIRPYNAVLGLTALPTAWRVSAGDGVSFGKAAVSAIVRLCLCAGVSVLAMIPQFLVWKTLYGTWFVVPKGSGYEQIRWSWVGLSSYAVSIVAFFPVLVAAFVGLALATYRGMRGYARDGRRTRFGEAVAPPFVVVLAAVSFLAGGSRDWMLGTAFGQRRIVDWLPFLALGLAVFWLKWGAGISPARGRWIAGMFAAANGLLVVLYLAKCLPQYGRLF